MVLCGQDLLGIVGAVLSVNFKIVALKETGSHDLYCESQHSEVT